jgi:outer membrane immunogenic protein
MKKILLTSAATIALCAPAIAADMPVKAPPPVPVVSWTGCYIGGNTGGAWAHKDTTELTVNGTFVGNNAGSTTASGWAYGGQIGCDYQFNNNWVVGVRGMWDGSNMRGSSHWLTFPNDTKYKIDSFGTLVGKLGVLLNPTVQLYGLAGVAWVHDSLTFTNSPGVGNFATGDQTRTGYDVGVGLSWMFARNWDLWVEYDHMGFGTKNLDLTGIGAGTGDFFTARVKQSVDKVLVGIDYRFDWGKAPVVAKY